MGKLMGMGLALLALAGCTGGSLKLPFTGADVDLAVGVAECVQGVIEAAKGAPKASRGQVVSTGLEGCRAKFEPSIRVRVDATTAS